MATAEKTTREQVEELYDKGTTEAKDIAEKIGKTPATVYVHLRNIAKERGEKPRGRGRPPKVQSDGNGSKPTTRKAPPKAGAKASGSKTQAKGKPGPKPGAKQAAPSKPETVAETANTNGHTHAEEFPTVKRAIEAELKPARARVAKLERMLAAFE